ncbi:hypothetical protein K8R66_01145 [bacterium]|nr:hypothetical protein [bacterium]
MNQLINNINVMDKEIKQKSVESYFSEFNILEDQKEKVLMAITDMVYSFNQRIIEYQKEIDPENKTKILKIIEEKEVLIREKIEKVLKGEEENITYDY